MNNYYVYIYWRLDINEPFYVGMGHNNRWKELKKYNRNKYFMRIANKHPIVCDIVIDNLTEEQAHGIECWLIHELVFEYGYSIDIPNNRSNEKGCHLVNCTWGGEGTSGLNPFENKTEEEMKEIIKKCIHYGNDNPSSRPVICLTTKKIFNTIKEASKYYNCNYGHIGACCRGERKSCGKLDNGEKLKWRYLEDFLNKCKYILL